MLTDSDEYSSDSEESWSGPSESCDKREPQHSIHGPSVGTKRPRARVVYPFLVVLHNIPSERGKDGKYNAAQGAGNRQITNALKQFSTSMKNTCKVLYEHNGAMTRRVGRHTRCVGYATFETYEEALAVSNSFEAQDRGRTHWEKYQERGGSEYTSEGVVLYGYLATEEDMIEIDRKRRLKWEMREYDSAVIKRKHARRRDIEILQARLEEQQKKLDEYETKEKELRDKSNEQEEKIEKLRKDLTRTRNELDLERAKSENYEREEYRRLEQLQKDLEAQRFEKEKALEKLREESLREQDNLKEKFRIFHEKEKLHKQNDNLTRLMEELKIVNNRQFASAAGMAQEFKSQEEVIWRQDDELTHQLEALQMSDIERRRLRDEEKKISDQVKNVKKNKIYNVQAIDKLGVVRLIIEDGDDNGECCLCLETFGPAPDEDEDGNEAKNKLLMCRHLCLPCGHIRLCGKCAKQIWSTEVKREEYGVTGTGPQLNETKPDIGKKCPICNVSMDREPVPFRLFF